MKNIILCSCLLLLCQTAQGLQIPFGRNYLFDSSYSSTPKLAEDPDIFATEISNSSEYLTGNASVQTLLREEILVSTYQNSSESTTDDHSTITTNSTSSSTDATTGTQTLAATFGNESQAQNSSQPTSGISYDGSIENTNSSETSNITVSSPANESNEDDQYGVARGKPSTTESSITTPPQSFYQKTWATISDTYTLSILVPVAAGVVFATSIILTLACCRCLRRCCIRRRMRKKVLPDSVKNLRPSDRARLLAESSDDEF